MTQTTLGFDCVASTAEISPCGRYRYLLGRRWSSGPTLGVILLNPSVADATVPDPTSTRVVGFARAEGYGAISIANLYAWRADDPKALRAVADPVGPENRRALWAVLRCGPVVAVGWGACRLSISRSVPARVAEVLELARMAGVELRTWGTTLRGAPGHPLYLPGARRLALWAPPDDRPNEMRPGVQGPGAGGAADGDPTRSVGNLVDAGRP